ncbi:MAG: heavy-metal-associated domain-containing protein [Leptospirales bacterium]|nr:heavy-metal-associated domain-containing protein [Leptospirales bacterium]
MLEYKASGMTCRSCVAHVTKAVKSVDPLAGVTVDLSNQTIRVEGNGDAEAIRLAIEAEGYPVSGFTTLQATAQ